MIRLERLTFGYGSAAPLLAEYCLEIARGEALAVLGPSGCGKTTLLYLLAGLLRPQRGQVRIDGMALERPRPRTGLVLQDHGLLPWATVRVNARLGLDIRRFYGPDSRHAPAGEIIAPAAAEARVTSWLQRLGLEGLEQRYPSQLSRGQRQRTAIARTLVLEPDLLLLDEPFSALDAPTRADLQQCMDDLQRQEGITRVIVTHDIEEAVRLGRRILLLTRGTNRTARLLDNPCAGLDPGGAQVAAACADLRAHLEALT
jgi:NitT/TauT family transport system ATP-binding protein